MTSVASWSRLRQARGKLQTETNHKVNPQIAVNRFKHTIEVAKSKASLKLKGVMGGKSGAQTGHGWSYDSF